ARLPWAEAVALIRGAGGVAGLAHPPYDLRETALRTMAEGGLGSVEVAGPGVDRRRGCRLRAWAERLDLVPNARSEFHVPHRPRPPRPLGRVDHHRGPRAGAAPGPLRNELRRTERVIKGLLERFKKGLSKTAQLFNVKSWFNRKVDESFLDDLEAKLIQADVGVAATGRIIDRVREAYGDKTAAEDLIAFVKEALKALLAD